MINKPRKVANAIGAMLDFDCLEISMNVVIVDLLHILIFIKYFSTTFIFRSQLENITV